MTETRLKKQPSNYKFPSLSDKYCNPTQFREWYNKIISILATDEWSKLYDKLHQEIIPNGHSQPILNNHL